MAGHPPPGGKTFKQIGKALGFSHQRAEQVYSAAIAKLRRSHGREFNEFLRLITRERNLSRLPRTARKASSA